MVAMQTASGPGNYVRLQATYVGRLGVPVGIFVAVDHLRRQGRLSDAEEELYFTIDDWFEEHLPNPPFYAEGNPDQAVTWFRGDAAAADGLRARLAPLQVVLDAHEVAHEVVTSDDPGRIIYLDHWQVGVIPYERSAPTPLDPSVTFTETSAGSKRAFARSLRPSTRRADT